jgi:carboxymethylenebutenolidase
MAFMQDWIRFGERDRCLGYLAQPCGVAEGLPGVIVLQEAWGVDAHIQDVTRRIAQAGYAALAPDLFAVDGRRPAALAAERMAELQGFINTLPPGAFGDAAARERGLAARTPQERQRIEESRQAMMALMSPDQHLPTLRAAAEHLRVRHAPSRGQGVCAIGFCMGGMLAAALACHDQELRGAVVFYGSAPAEAQIPAIACPVLGLYGERDRRLVDPLPAFAEAMRTHGKRFESHVYPGAEHAFFNDERPTYQAAAARAAWARALAFMAEANAPARQQAR